jgi:hypothetical protein
MYLICGTFFLSRGEGPGDRKEVMRMEIYAKQLTFVVGGAMVAGEPVDDDTKVVVAMVADPGQAFALAMAIATGMAGTMDVDDEQVVEVLEKPKG